MDCLASHRRQWRYAPRPARHWRSRSAAAYPVRHYCTRAASRYYPVGWQATPSSRWSWCWHHSPCRSRALQRKSGHGWYWRSSPDRRLRLESFCVDSHAGITHRRPLQNLRWTHRPRCPGRRIHKLLYHSDCPAGALPRADRWRGNWHRFPYRWRSFPPPEVSFR